MKSKKIILVLLSVVLITGGIIIGAFTYDKIPMVLFSISHINRTYVSNKNFNDHYEDFCVIIDVALKNKDKLVGDKNSFFAVDYKNGIPCLYYSVDNYSDFDVVYIELTQEEQKSLEKVCDSFEAGNFLDVIRIYENGISFDIIEDRYVLAYTFNGSKPNFINWEGYNLNIKKIRNNWYHVTGNSTR